MIKMIHKVADLSLAEGLEEYVLDKRGYVAEEEQLEVLTDYILSVLTHGVDIALNSTVLPCSR
ncbi:hypothetical protein J6590_024791 [Homalodisca vitripennis]|nr:hypothetical protein J6590_024791 [Homalodisca vitripennis]